MDRAWTRRPLVSEPYFGQLVPALWTESEVVFYGMGEPVDNGHGGFSATREAYLTTRAHVDIESTTEATVEGMGTVQRRFLRVFIPWTFGTTQRLPTRGDLIQWVADTGQQYTVEIKTVTSPETLHSHLEIESEAID